MNLPENFKIVVVGATAAADSVTYDTISCKDALKVWFIVSHIGDSDTDCTLSLVESTDVANSTTTAVTATFPIWVNKTVNLSGDTLTKQTDAASYSINTTTATERDQLVVIEWDPAKFSSGYDCIQLADTGGNNSNNITALAIIETRYPQATPPTVITD